MCHGGTFGVLTRRCRDSTPSTRAAWSSIARTTDLAHPAWLARDGKPARATCRHRAGRVRMSAQIRRWWENSMNSYRGDSGDAMSKHVDHRCRLSDRLGALVRNLVQVSNAIDAVRWIESITRRWRRALAKAAAAKKGMCGGETWRKATRFTVYRGCCK